jgi:hypothetical protein
MTKKILVSLVVAFVAGLAAGVWFCKYSSAEGADMFSPNMDVLGISDEALLYFSFVSPKFAMTAQRAQLGNGFEIQVTSSNVHETKRCSRPLSSVQSDFSSFLTVRAVRKIEKKYLEKEFPDYFGALILGDLGTTDTSLSVSYLRISKDGKSILFEGDNIETDMSISKLKQLEHFCDI